MRAKLEIKKQVIDLRKQGLSYNQILEKVHVSKSSLSGWLKYIEYSDSELKLLQQKINERKIGGRMRASLANRERRIVREQKSVADAGVIFDKNIRNPLFIIGIVMYWAEGSKRTGEFQFINSDPEMISFMVYWIKKFMGTDKIKYRLFMHKIYDYENCEAFWGKIVGARKEDFEKTIYKPNKHKVKKSPNYKGCLRLSIGGIDNLRKVKAFQKLLVEYYSSKMRP